MLFCMMRSWTAISGKVHNALTIFSLSKNARSVFSDVFPRKGAVPSKKVRRILGLEEGKTILDR